MKRWAWMALGLSLFLAACVPRMVTPTPPKAKLLGAELLGVDPFQDRFSLRLKLNLENPNPYDLPLLKSELKVQLAGFGTRSTLPRVTLPARGQRVVEVLVEGPIASAADPLRRLINGEAVPITLTARTQVEAYGLKLWLGPFVLLEDELRLADLWRPPRLRLVGARAELSGGTLRLLTRVEVTNPTPLGFALGGEGRAWLEGVALGAAPLSLKLAPFGTGLAELALEVPLYQIPSLAGQLRSGASLRLEGRLVAEAPGLFQRVFELQLQGRLP